MRILIVSAFFEGHGGGIEVVAGTMARALSRLGHQCRWAAAAFDKPPADPLIEPIALGSTDPLERWTGLPMPLPSRAARRRLEQEVAAADAVIVHDALYASSLLAARYSSKHGKPWILVQHIGIIPYRNWALRLAITAANRLITRPLLAAAPQAVFISDAVRATFAGPRWKSAPSLLLNGVDHQLFRFPAEAERHNARRFFSMSDDRRELLFVGRFVEKKGLWALREIARANPAWRISLVGSGPIDPSSWNLANVRLLGRMNREQLAELYRAADALVLPSVGEGFPLVVQEAMACGLPIFCGFDSGAADPGAAGMLHALEVEPADPIGTARRFAAAIEESNVGPDERLSAYARTTYDSDRNARWLVERFEEFRLSGEDRGREAKVALAGGQSLA